MGLVVVKEKLTKKDLNKSREEYRFYIKVTVDIEQKILVIGGEYHSDAEKVLLERWGSKQRNIWGGGFNLKTNQLETNAIINIRPGVNDSMEIINSELRNRFLNLVRSKLQNIEDLI